MAKSGRGNAPRDRKRGGLAFPKPPCEPTPPRHPGPPVPPGPGETTYPDPRKLIERLERLRKKK
jgi:hypothetical protein